MVFSPEHPCLLGYKFNNRYTEHDGDDELMNMLNIMNMLLVVKLGRVEVHR